MKSVTFLLLGAICVHADMYLHNPRGSNNRLDEEGRERNNANRLFDSQNNNRGGYNVGSVYYYAGSKLMIEWTNQHSCENPNNHCEIIIQYMCAGTVRDGSTTATIPENPLQCRKYDCNSDTQYGMHEDYDYYMNCKMRQRNKGLFTADQNLKNKNQAKNTRQNPNGNRRGYECPEERDYYPYWHPTPWKDIVVMSNDPTRCLYYQAESENVKSRWQCSVPREILLHNQDVEVPNNKEECEAFRWPQNDPDGKKAVWQESPSHNLPPPDCMESQFSRDNHLGNGFGGYHLSYNWTVPDLPHDRCAIRIRYNVSTNEYEAWDGVNATHNKPVRKRNSADLDITAKYGFSTREAGENRGYVFKNNPEVSIFPGVENIKLRLAINTAQFGRTFQDRSHTFAIRARPPQLEGAVIHNLNVRGKRGNIVQVYPAVEYDFTPNTLEVTNGHYIHFQWTGSNTNPNNNDGQGRAGTDRSNVVLQGVQPYSEGSGAAYALTTKYGHWGRSYPELIKNSSLMGFSRDDLLNLATLRSHQFRGEMSELDDAGTYFDLGPRKVTKSGVYHYLCTRNNNFSNRSQKGRIIATTAEIEQQSIGWNGGNITLSDGQTGVVVQRRAFAQRYNMRIERWTKEEGKRSLELAGKSPPDDSLISDFVVIHPEGRLTAEGWTFDVSVKVSPSSMQDVVIYRTNSDSNSWIRIEAYVSNDYANFVSEEGGVYVAVGYQKAGIIAGAVIGALAGVALIAVGTAFYFRKNPEKLNQVKRSFAARV